MKKLWLKKKSGTFKNYSVVLFLWYKMKVKKDHASH